MGLVVAAGGGGVSGYWCLYVSGLLYVCVCVFVVCMLCVLCVRLCM